MKELGAKLFLDSGTLTPLLKKMEKDGLIRRCHNEKDERTLIIALTDKGKSLKEQCKDIPKMVAGCSHIKAENAVVVRDYLHSIIKCLTSEI